MFAKLGVIGAGKMGSALIKLFLKRTDADITVLTRQVKQASRSRLTFTDNPGDLGDCQLVVETVVEDFDTKQKILSSIPDGPIIGSCTSSLSINKLSSSCPNPNRFLGLHFINPVSRMPLVEVIPSSCTTQETLQTAISLVQLLGKEHVIVPDIPGFLLNRILLPSILEAQKLVESGIEPGCVDKVMQLGAGWPIGPMRLGEMIGRDTLQLIIKNLTHCS